MADRAIVEMAQRWQESGIEARTLLLVHSSIRRAARSLLKAGRPGATAAEDILASFIEAVGPEGTLLFPLFNFEFTQGVPFDICSTPSHMGALTEAARLHPAAVRTGHPIYSFAVIGREAERFQSIDNFSGYGPDSPFAVLHHLGGKIAVLDLPDQRSMTFYHYVEECHSVPYRFHKRFEGSYTGQDGVPTNRTYGLFVRNIDNGVLTHVDPMGEILWQRGLYSGSRPGDGSGLRVIAAAELYNAVSEIIRSGRAEGILYRIDKVSK